MNKQKDGVEAQTTVCKLTAGLQMGPLMEYNTVSTSSDSFLFKPGGEDG